MKSESYCPPSAYTPAAMMKPAEDFVTVTPMFLTSFGKRPCAVATRFCTSTAARSWLRPTLNVAVTVLTPLLVLVDVM
jgi:hypothetical protein